MTPLTYRITRGEHGYPQQFHDVKGFVMFELFGYQWATHQELPGGNWIVSEVSTGHELESGKFFESKEEAKEWAWDYLIRKGEILTRFYLNKAKMKIQEHEQRTEAAVR